MRRSSETIGTIAAALAKAQIALTNPEKALTATINGRAPGERNRAFRYAPLSAGLDIVRKTLGSNGIAIVQATAIDGEAQLLRLTTTLAHASGEWMSSDWPVCALAEAASPKRMGAALTYARRYALFTLVGIAGEDDLDAPDLQEVGARVRAGREATGGARRDERPNSKPRSSVLRPARLDAVASANLREELLGEVAALASDDGAAHWAQKALSRKDALTNADSAAVEAAFAVRLEAFADAAVPTQATIADLFPPFEAVEARSSSDGAAAATPIIVASAGPAGASPRRAVTAKSIRLRDKEHCRFVASQPCVVCGRMPSEAHHIRYAQPRAMGRKVSDEFTVPVCRTHHRELHRYGDEASWWAGVGIDPVPIALGLWRTRNGGGAP